MKFTNAISKHRIPILKNNLLLFFLTSFIIFWVTTLIGTTDLANWFLENALVIIFILVLFTTYKNLQFSDLSYLLIFVYLI